MEKSEFLKEISSLSREDIQKKISEKEKIRKKICPAVYIKARDKNPKPSTRKK